MAESSIVCDDAITSTTRVDEKTWKKISPCLTLYRIYHFGFEEVITEFFNKDYLPTFN